MPDLPEVVRETPAEVGTLLLVGHNPGLEELVTDLAADAVGDAPDRVGVKHPTSAVAVPAWHGTSWRALAPGTAPLTATTVPRGG